MSFEDILEVVGSFHSYQYRLILFIFLTTFMCAVNYYNQILIFAAPAHRCKHQISEIEQIHGNNWTFMQSLAPWDDPERERGKSCYRYDYAELNDFNPWPILNTTERLELFERIGRHLRHRQPCPKGELIFNFTSMFKTLAFEKDWVCDLDQRPATLNQVFWVGNVFGCFVWGITNDVFGRRPTVLASNMLYFAGGLLTYFSTWSFPLLLCCRFLVGMAHHTVSHLPYLIALEYCGQERRTIPLLAMMASYSLGSSTIPWMIKVLPSWEYLLAMATLPNLIVIAAYKWIPESPSWLLCKGHFDKAGKMLQVVAKANGKDYQPALSLLEEKRQQYNQTQDQESMRDKFLTVLSLFRYPRLLLHLILAVCMCIVGFMCYYGHVENTSNLGGDLAHSFFYGALVEVPAYSVPFLINYLGRKPMLFVLFSLSGASSIGYGYLPEGHTNDRLSLALFGRMFATGAYYICLQFASEVLPTIIRGSGVALCEIMGGIGLFICPLIVYLGKTQNELPLLIFGALSVFGTVLVLLLPETAHCTLPQTMDEGNILGKDQNMCGRKKQQAV